MADGVRKWLCISMANFIKIGQMIEEIWLFNGFQNGGCRRSWILKFKFLIARAVNRPVLHHRAKFHEDSQHVAEISRFFCDFQDGGC